MKWGSQKRNRTVFHGIVTRVLITYKFFWMGIQAKTRILSIPILKLPIQVPSNFRMFEPDFLLTTNVDEFGKVACDDLILVGTEGCPPWWRGVKFSGMVSVAVCDWDSWLFTSRVFPQQNTWKTQPARFKISKEPSWTTSTNSFSITRWWPLKIQGPRKTESEAGFP